MTDNITKLYELAGIKKKRMCDWTCQNSEVCDADCEHFMQSSVHYPPFTNSKQLELIKWLGLDFAQNSILHIDRWTSGKVRFALDKEKYTEPYYESDYAYGDKDFSQALSGLIIDLWKDLTDEQKAEIKRILQ